MSVSLFGALTADAVTPIDDDGEGLRDAARRLFSHYDALNDAARGAGSTWSSLPEYLSADALTPILEPLITPAVMHASQLRDAAEQFYRVASSAADEISDLKRRHDRLVADIEAFHASAPGQTASHIAKQAASGDILGAAVSTITSWQDVPSLVADEADLRWRLSRYESDLSSTLASIAGQINAIDAPRTAGLGDVGTAAAVSMKKSGSGGWWARAKKYGELFGGLAYASTVGVTVEETKKALPYIEQGLSTAANATLSFGSAVLQHGDDDAAMFGGALLAAGGIVVTAAGIAGDATIVLSGPGAALTAGGLAMVGGGAGLVGTGASDLAIHAATDDAEEPLPTDQVEKSREPNPNHPGRDTEGKYMPKDNDKAREDFKAKEAQGLSRYERQTGFNVDRDQVTARIEGSDSGRRYDGLAQKHDGTWEGIEIKSGTAKPSAQQKAFDSLVSPENPAYATLKNGDVVKITSVRVINVK